MSTDNGIEIRKVSEIVFLPRGPAGSEARRAVIKAFLQSAPGDAIRIPEAALSPGRQRRSGLVAALRRHTNTRGAYRIWTDTDGQLWLVKPEPTR